MGRGSNEVGWVTWAFVLKVVWPTGRICQRAFRPCRCCRRVLSGGSFRLAGWESCFVGGVAAGRDWGGVFTDEPPPNRFRFRGGRLSALP